MTTGYEAKATVDSVAQMHLLGAAISDVLLAGDVIALNGDLGAGKTCFVQGIARGMGVAQPVTSPTFVLMREYAGRVPLVHVDVYRLSSLADVHDLGDDVCAPDRVTAIEWAEAVRPVLGDTYLDVDIAITAGDSYPERRTVTFTAYGESWAARHQAVAKACAPFTSG